ncbi:MAG: DUF4922 domain-containing protein [Massilibacteroides sp.]|nr:DUF4922 domain-containing protein [Massilibacteroides sp.]MDD3062190.1 DUF4922 domain-containing protein [Massilibacteroides sp.]MDD4114416.1 DUF4922 domain-containing protein [Massilibacteroides sp.]MDD4659708.1 DUF4922 domain-containing protein [Massilibacteroides sp.]
MNDEAKLLFEEQLVNWPLAKRNYAALEQVQMKTFVIAGNTFNIQFNPVRIVSTAAKIDVQSIRKRACFLCRENRPVEQKGIPLLEKYTLLINPFPIFPRHLTIPEVTHTPQRIEGHFTDMLELANTFDDYILFYNGAHCGASAPDHMHFQAGNKGVLPFENEWKRKRTLLRQAKRGNIWKISDNLRTGWILEGDDPSGLHSLFNTIYKLLPIVSEEEEPRINLLLWREEAKWIAVLFPRKTHRPACFFAEGEAQLTVSPASVDLGGVFIIPREQDFEKINPEKITRIIQEVCLDKITTEKINNRLKTQI